ncbi:hypothetical protein CDL15_Pgr027952 [Punica granatum]|nr:hypothetical protein CDL15_Pgr027952 [Punica granatum]
MKGSCTLLASVLTASAAAVTSSASASASPADPACASYPCSKQVQSSQSKVNVNSTSSSLEKKFAPRFDGIRFIETLVTAHR